MRAGSPSMPTEPVTTATYQGLTHECDDPACHVPAYVETLTLRDTETADPDAY